jgi:hypothetical protein
VRDDVVRFFAVTVQHGGDVEGAAQPGERKRLAVRTAPLERLKNVVRR